MESLVQFIELVGGALASILTIIVFVKIVVLPFCVKLEIQLTKDLFFRLVSSGEIFFARVIVHAPANIQITNVSFELKGSKQDTQETSYNCKAEKFGSVERNSINEHSLASFYLPKNSPEFLLKKGESKEILIQCNIVGSKQEIEKSIELLQKDYTTLALQQNQLGDKNKSIIEGKLKKYSTDILSNIKLESGRHTLFCKIVYTYKYSFITRRRTVESKVNINIADNSLKNIYKNQPAIEKFLFDYLSSFHPNNKNMYIRYPECRVD